MRSATRLVGGQNPEAVMTVSHCGNNHGDDSPQEKILHGENAIDHGCDLEISRFVDNHCMMIRVADHCHGIVCQCCAQNERCLSCRAVADLLEVVGCTVGVPVGHQQLPSSRQKVDRHGSDAENLVQEIPYAVDVVVVETLVLALASQVIGNGHGF